MDPKKLALGAGAAILTSGLIGGAAFAALAPGIPTGTTSVAEPGLAATAVDKGGKPGGLKAVLDKLVADTKITRAQADQILAAVKDAEAAKPRSDHAGAKGVLGELMKTASDYLGLDAKALATQLHSGKSLGEIAGTTTGKSRDGLVQALTTAANAKIDAAVTAKKLTPDQATKLRAGLGAHIAMVVDHKAGPRPEHPKKP